MRASVDLGEVAMPKRSHRHGPKRLIIELEVGDRLTISGRRFRVVRRLGEHKLLIMMEKE